MAIAAAVAALALALAGAPQPALAATIDSRDCEWGRNERVERGEGGREGAY